MLTCLRALTTDTAGQLDVLGHDRNTLGVDRAQVGVLEQSNQVSLSSLLECEHCRSLEAEISLEVLRDLADQSLEGELAHQQLSRLLVSADLAKSHGSGAVSVRLLHSSGSRSALTSRLGGELLSGSLSSGRLSRSLLCSCHCVVLNCENNTSVPQKSGFGGLKGFEQACFLGHAAARLTN